MKRGGLEEENLEAYTILQDRASPATPDRWRIAVGGPNRVARQVDWRVRMGPAGPTV